MALVKRENVELARIGNWHAKSGPWNCTRGQLADAVRAYKSGRFRNPILMRRGHSDSRFDSDEDINADGEPALGVVRNLRLAEGGDSLVGDLLVQEEFDRDFAATYPSRSVEADLGVETSDGEKYQMILTKLAVLGATKPAIQPLAELAAAEAELQPEQTIEFTAAMSVAASMGGEPDVAAGFFDEKAHPRGGKGTAAGGKFVAKGSGYAKDGKGGEASTVKEVQQELIRLGLLSPDSGKNGGKDGLFGPKTEAAVKKWQAAHGHLATGKVSTELLATLKSAKSGAKPTKPKGKADERVKADLRPKRDKVKAAAEELVAGIEHLHPREIRDDVVVFDDREGRVFLSAWSEDGDDIVLADPVPATVTYTPIGGSVAAAAAHAMHLPLCYARDWEVNASSTSHAGDTSVDIAQLREALGLDESTDEAAVLAHVATLRTTSEAASLQQENDASKTEALPAAQEVQSEKTTDQSEDTAPNIDAIVAEKVAAALAPIAASTAAYEAKIGELSTELADRRANEAATVKAQVLASALKDGKIAPAAREQWEKDYDEAPGVTTRILASLKPGTAVPIAASGYAGGDDTLVDESDEILRAAGLGHLIGGNS